MFLSFLIKWVLQWQCIILHAFLLRKKYLIKNLRRIRRFKFIRMNEKLLKKINDTLKSTEEDSFDSKSINDSVINVTVVSDKVSNYDSSWGTWTLSINNAVSWSQRVTVSVDWNDLWCSWNRWISFNITSTKWSCGSSLQWSFSSNWVDSVINVVIRQWSFSQSDCWCSVSGFFSWLSKVKLVHSQLPIPLSSW